jgi:hypothetical protein
VPALAAVEPRVDDDALADSPAVHLGTYLVDHRAELVADHQPLRPRGAEAASVVHVPIGDAEPDEGRTQKQLAGRRARVGAILDGERAWAAVNQRPHRRAQPVRRLTSSWNAVSRLSAVLNRLRL